MAEPAYRTPTDHGRWPAEGKRDKSPAHWLLWFGWRRFVIFTPKVGLRSLQIVVTPLPFRFRKSAWVGLWVGKDEDDNEWQMQACIGVLEIEVHLMEWLQ